MSAPSSTRSRHRRFSPIAGSWWCTDAGRLLAADAARLVVCLDDPLPGVTLVLGAGSGTIPAALVKAVERHGLIVDTSVGTGRARTQWLVDRLHDGPVKLDARAAGPS